MIRYLACTDKENLEDGLSILKHSATKIYTKNAVTIEKCPPGIEPLDFDNLIMMLRMMVFMSKSAHERRFSSKKHRASESITQGKVNCATLLLVIGGVLISLPKAMSP